MALSSENSTKANRLAIREVVKLYKKRDPEDLMWFYEVGQVLKQLECDGGSLGRTIIRAAAEELPGTLSLETRVNELTAARQFVRHYPKRMDVEKLVRRARRQGMKFGVTHARYLGSIVDQNKRLLFVELCLQEKWSATRLRAEIEHDRQHANPGGRTFATPATRKDGLHNLLEQSKEWLGRFEQIWFGGLLPVTGEPDPNEKPEDIARLVRDALKLLRQMAKAIEVAIRELAAIERQAKKGHRSSAKLKRTKTPSP